MSKFQSTISTVAALASIFGAGAAGWKLAQSQPDYKPEEPQPAIEQKLTQLEQKLEKTLVAPSMPVLPSSQTTPEAPVTHSLPPVPTPPPVAAVPPAPEPPPQP